MRRSVLCAATLFTVAASPAVAASPHATAHSRHRHHRWHPPARAYAPPLGRAFHGVSDTHLGRPDVRLFQRQVGAHPAVLEDFYHWGTPLTTGALDRWQGSHARGILSLATADGGQPELISPGQIAKGRGDDYIVRLNLSIVASGQVVYIRLMPEMNGSWNPYSAYNLDGTRRDAHHSTQQFRHAWRRFAIIVHGGTVKAINRRLLAQHMPRLLRAGSNHDPIYGAAGITDRLSHPKVALIWNPQTISSPGVPGNRVSAYWPGRRYVDWIGADIYSKYATPGVRAALTRFYRNYGRRFPFMIGEYSPWDDDVHGEFVRWLFHWARRHDRTQMLVYYRSVYAHSPYDIGNYRRARLALRKILDAHRFMPYAPGLRPR